MSSEGTIEDDVLGLLQVMCSRQDKTDNLDHLPNWDNDDTSLTGLHVSSEGTIEDNGLGLLQMICSRQTDSVDHLPNWDNDDNRLTGLHVSSEGTTEDDRLGLLQVMCSRQTERQTVWITYLSGIMMISDWQDFMCHQRKLLKMMG